MALESSLIPVLFSKALDQKNNYKTQLPGTFLTLDNAVRRKESLWEKRYGFSALQSPPVLTGKTLAQISEGLCYADGLQLHSYSSTANAWSTAAGVAIPVSFSRASAFRHNTLTTQGSSAYAGGLIMTVCTTDAGSTGAITVTDAASGAVLLAPTKAPNGFKNCKVVAIGATFLLFGNNGTNFCVSPIASSLFSTNNGQTLIQTVTTIQSGQIANYDICVNDALSVAVAYQHPSNNSIVVANVTAGAVVGNGSNGYPAPVTITAVGTPATLGAYCIGIFVEGGNTFVGHCSGTDTYLYCTVYGAALTTPATYTLDTQGIAKRNVGFYSYTQSATTYVIPVYECGNPQASADGVASNIFTNAFTVASGTATWLGITTNSSSLPVIRCAGMASKFFTGSDGQVYALISYDSNLQPSYFLMQFSLNTTVFPGPLVVAHFKSDGSGGGHSRSFNNPQANEYGSWLSDIAQDASGNFYCPVVVVTQEVSNVSGVFAIQSTGIDVYKLALAGPFQRAKGGPTVQLAAGQVNDYDGQGVSELGFHLFPEGITATAATGGSLTGGDYYFKVCFECVDNQGQIHRSAPSTPIKAASVAASDKVTLTVPGYFLTNRPSVWSTQDVQCVVYQSKDAEVYYRSKAVSASFVLPNVYTYSIVITGEAIAPNPILYTVGGVLDNDPVPACNVVHAHKNRLWLAGLEKNEIRFSKEFETGDGIAFSSAFAIPVGAADGDATAYATLDDKLIIFKKESIYFLVGEGPDPSGANWDYPEPIRIPSDVGTVYPRAVVETPGGVIFKSSKGWYMLTRALQLSYIGAPVEDYNGLTPSSATIVPSESEVRIVHTDGSCLVYNHLFSQWSTFSNYEGYDSVTTNGVYYRLAMDHKVYKETPGAYLDAGSRISLTVETSWLSIARLQGYQRVYALQILADFVDDHQLEVQIAYDFQNTYNQTVNFTTTGVISGTVLQLRIQPAIQKCTAVKLRIVDNDTVSPSGGASLKPTSLAVEVGRKKGAVRLPPAQSL